MMKKATLADVAALAEVSKATVSRYLKDENVKEDIALRIAKALSLIHISHAVVVGSAITRPHLTAKRFVDLLGGYQDNWREAEKAKH